jgi:hypothetical protein
MPKFRNAFSVPTSGPSQFNPTNKDESTKNNSQDKPTDSAAPGSSACSEQVFFKSVVDSFYRLPERPGFFFFGHIG